MTNYSDMQKALIDRRKAATETLARFRAMVNRIVIEYPQSVAGDDGQKPDVAFGFERSGDFQSTSDTDAITFDGGECSAHIGVRVSVPDIRNMTAWIPLEITESAKDGDRYLCVSAMNGESSRIQLFDSTDLSECFDAITDVVMRLLSKY